MTKYAMAIDTRRCSGCNRCSTNCKAEHNTPKGVLWCKAIGEGGDYNGEPGGEYPYNLSIKYYSLSCQHCDNPACYGVCPTGATKVREDGIVWVDYDLCIGCQACIAACPYEGVRTYLKDAPEYYIDVAMGDDTIQEHRAGVVEKCTFCYERLDRGERPACVDVCVAHARYFGDLEDPESEVSRVLAKRNHERLLEDQGTESKVYLLL